MVRITRSEATQREQLASLLARLSVWLVLLCDQHQAARWLSGIFVVELFPLSNIPTPIALHKANVVRITRSEATQRSSWLLCWLVERLARFAMRCDAISIKPLAGYLEFLFRTVSTTKTFQALRALHKANVACITRSKAIQRSSWLLCWLVERLARFAMRKHKPLAGYRTVSTIKHSNP